MKGSDKSPVIAENRMIYFIEDDVGDLKVHRDDGPAVEWNDGSRHPLWYWHGYLCQDFNEWFTFAADDRYEEHLDNEQLVMLKLKYG